MDRSLENAAQDLFATPVMAFFKVTLPMIFPGIVAGFMLAFVLSSGRLRDHELRLGPRPTFPIVGLRRDADRAAAQVNVWARVLFVGGVARGAVNLLFVAGTPEATKAHASTADVLRDAADKIGTCRWKDRRWETRLGWVPRARSRCDAGSPDGGCCVRPGSGLGAVGLAPMLAACSSASTRERPRSRATRPGIVNFANWPLYIDRARDANGGGPAIPSLRVHRRRPASRSTTGR